jgi:hypothetical protein
MARYQDAIFWLASNEDMTWLDDPYGSPSVTTCLVIDLFGKEEEQVIADVRKELARLQRKWKRNATPAEQAKS